MISSQKPSSSKTSSDNSRKVKKPKTLNLASSLSLPAMLNSRQIDPFRLSLKRNIVNSLCNGYYSMNSDGELTDLLDYVTSLQMDPAEEKFLLYGTTKGRLKVCSIQECDYSKDFISSEIGVLTFNNEYDKFKVMHSQWYPFDSGMFCVVHPKGVFLYDTNQFEEITGTTISEDKCQSCDWNSRDYSTIAISTISPRVKLYDIRTQNALSTITVSGPAPANQHHHTNRQVTRVYWSPMDQFGLFVGDSIGDIFLYDTRQLRRPLAVQHANDHQLYLPVAFMQMTPDLIHLVTTHYNSGAITQWRLQPNRTEMLANTHVNYQSDRKADRHKADSFIKQTLLLTMDRIYAPNLFNSGPDLFCFDRHTGSRVRQHELSHPQTRRPVIHVIGFRRTKFGDDPNPAIIYTSASQIVVSRMQNYAEPFDFAEECGTGPVNLSRGQTIAHNQLFEDRWSDSD